MTPGYETSCKTCGISSTIVTKGKWQCQHCGARNDDGPRDFGPDRHSIRSAA